MTTHLRLKDGSVLRVWDLDEADLPEDLYPLRDLFLRPRRYGNTKKSLHDILTAKGLTCLCANCRQSKLV